ncbi:MAG TPA: CHAD domain-containing protein [Pyrinomonadaceae bacterium]
MAKVKRIAGLHCLAPADKMLPLVLRAQLKKMCALGDKALDWKDPEGVHDMRVLSRRLRSAISDFKPYVRKSTLPRQKLVAIAKRLGAVRDEDVALAALEELKTKAPGLAAEGIEMLAEERRQRRKEARTALKAVIKASAVSDFRKEFTTKLRAIAIVPQKKLAGKQVDETGVFACVGAEIIKDRLKELCAASSHIYLPFENKELHELRILAKRLRYSIELFGACWGDEMEEIAREIALLQTSLGELHDCDVWMGSLGTRLKQTARKNRKDEDNIRLREGASWLLKHFARERMEHYREALTRWQHWEAGGFLERLKSILDQDFGSSQKRPPKVQASLSSSPASNIKPI